MSQKLLSAAVAVSLSLALLAWAVFAQYFAYPDLVPSHELVIQGVFRALIRRAKE